MSLICQPLTTDRTQSVLLQLLKQYILLGQGLYQYLTSSTADPQPRVSTHIPQLPPEVILVILRHLLITARHTFTQTLRVSRNWAEIGTPLLWRDISLDLPRLAYFNRSLTLSVHNVKYIRSLTLKLEVSDRGGVLEELSGLSEHIGRLENITTISFSLTARHVVSTHPIEEFLKELPPSVTALEISCLPLSLSNAHYLCFRIRNLLPQLEHLRTDRAQLCTDILPKKLSTFPRLRTVVINESSRSCASIHLARSWEHEITRTDLCGEEIALKARRFIEAGCMPSLEKFVVFTSCPSPPLLPRDPTTTTPRPADEDQTDQSITTGQYFLKKNVLTNKTTSYLHCAMPRNPVTRAMRYYDTTKNDNLHILGNFRELNTVLEEEDGCSWMETLSGVRYPSSFRHTRQSRSESYVWNQPLMPRTFDPWAKGSEVVRALGEITLNPWTFDGLRRPSVTT